MELVDVCKVKEKDTFLNRMLSFFLGDGLNFCRVKWDRRGNSFA